MLQAHSFLWHYLWVAPNVLLMLLALQMWKRGLHREFPAFFCYAVFESVGGSVLYTIDVIPSFSGITFWWASLGFLIVEVFIKFIVVGEIFTHLLRRYPSLGRLAKVLISSLGIILVFTATIIAAYANQTPFWLVSTTRILGRSVSVVQCGLILFLFVFAAHFHLRWEHRVFGITLGFGIIASVYLAYWAVMTDWLFGQKGYLFDFVIMTVYHACVLIWCYYLLVPHKVEPTAISTLPEHDLEVWNDELERLLQR